VSIRESFSVTTHALIHIALNGSSHVRSLSLGGAEQWDKAVMDANREYRTRMHNICCDNCHSHVAYALNSMNISAFGIKSWDMVKLCFLIFFRGRFLSWFGFLAQFLPFGVIVLVVALVKTL
jgi:hypothetical protein